MPLKTLSLGVVWFGKRRGGGGGGGGEREVGFRVQLTVQEGRGKTKLSLFIREWKLLKTVL